ncbi:MAG TPA: DUF4136 domain-containing protein [Rhizobacter sp.]|nr:DUF4136 domain-containing protein [Rhizobacter sp.]
MRLCSLVVLVVAAALSGCAALNTLDTDVATYSQWPAERKPSTYAFERLPSQQARPQEQAQLESIARPALISAGFQEVADPKDADVTVQLGMRVTRTGYPYYADPFIWYGPYYHSRRPYWGPGYGNYWGPGYWGPGFWGPGFAYDRYDHEVVLLLLDSKTHQPLYEARAASAGLGGGGDRMTAAMFMAAMKDFPHTGVNPRRISVQLPG